MQYLISSTIGSGIAELCTLPICTTKTVYQNTNSNSIRSTFTNIYTTRGYKGFFDSSKFAVTSQMFSSTSKYFLYRSFTNDLNMNIWIAGPLSGAISSLFTHPIDVFKIHRQMGESLVDKLRVSNRPISILYQGYTKTVKKYGVGSLCFLPIKDYFTPKLGSTKSAFISAVISTIIIHPFDHMKVRQSYGIKSPTIKNMYKGLSLNLLRVVPHFTIMMTAIDFIEKIYEQKR